MAVAVRNATSAIRARPLPAPVTVAGDLLLAFFAWELDFETGPDLQISGSGWTSLARTGAIQGSVSDPAGVVGTQVWGKFPAADGEPGITINSQGSGTDYYLAAAVSVSGAQGLPTVTVSQGVSASGTTAVTSPAGAPATSSDLGLRWAVGDDYITPTARTWAPIGTDVAHPDTGYITAQLVAVTGSLDAAQVHTASDPLYAWAAFTLCVSPTATSAPVQNVSRAAAGRAASW